MIFVWVQDSRMKLFVSLDDGCQTNFDRGRSLVFDEVQMAALKIGCMSSPSKCVRKKINKSFIHYFWISDAPWLSSFIICE